MFAEHLKRMREAAGRTQEELARYLRISPQSVSKWEKGQSLPSIDFLPSIADFFDCTINAFFSEYELKIFEALQAHAPTSEDIIKMLVLAIPNKEAEGKLPGEGHITAEQTIPTEALFLPEVVRILEEYEAVGSGTLQWELKVGYGVAARIRDSLESLGVLRFDEESKQYKVVKSKIRLLEPYLD